MEIMLTMVFLISIVQIENINLTHIESRPSKKQAGYYDFYVDCECSNAETLQRVTSRLQDYAVNVGVLSTQPLKDDIGDGSSGMLFGSNCYHTQYCTLYAYSYGIVLYLISIFFCIK